MRELVGGRTKPGVQSSVVFAITQNESVLAAVCDVEGWALSSIKEGSRGILSKPTGDAVLGVVARAELTISDDDSYLEEEGSSDGSSGGGGGSNGVAFLLLLLLASLGINWRYSGMDNKVLRTLAMKRSGRA